MNPPRRGGDARTLAIGLIVVGLVLGVVIGRSLWSDRDASAIEGTFFLVVSGTVVGAGMLIGASNVVIVDRELRVRNGLRRHAVDLGDIAAITADTRRDEDHDDHDSDDDDGRGVDAEPVSEPRGRSRARTVVPIVELNDGGTVGLVAYLMEPSLRRQSIGDDGLDQLAEGLRVAVERRRDGDAADSDAN